MITGFLLAKCHVCKADFPPRVQVAYDRCRPDQGAERRIRQPRQHHPVADSTAMWRLEPAYLRKLPACRKRRSKARVDGSRELSSPVSMACITSAAICLPNSTPHWSKAFVPQMMLWMN